MDKKAAIDQAIIIVNTAIQSGSIQLTREISGGFPNTEALANALAKSHSLYLSQLISHLSESLQKISE